MFSDNDKIKRMIQIAELYYEKDMTQNQIAQELGISRPLVSILLNDAKSCGIVNINIRKIDNIEQIVEEQLQERFPIKRAIVIPNTISSEKNDIDLIHTAYDYCFNEKKLNQLIGIGWGSMIGRMIEYPESYSKNTVKNSNSGKLIPLIGGIGATYRSYHTNEIVRVLSENTHLKAEYLYLPAFFDSKEELELVKNMDSYKNINKMWSEMDSAILNISNFPSYPDLGVEYRFDTKKLRSNAVGRILAHYYDIHGNIVTPLIDNALQASSEQLTNVPDIVALCSSLLNPSSVYGAMKTGIIDTIIIPYELAKNTLKIKE